MPVARSVNGKKVVGASPLGIALTNANPSRSLALRAATEFASGEGERRKLCSQTRAAMEPASIYLDGNESRLAVCQRCWGSRAFLSRDTTSTVDFSSPVAGRVCPVELTTRLVSSGLFVSCAEIVLWFAMARRLRMIGSEKRSQQVTATLYITPSSVSTFPNM